MNRKRLPTQIEEEVLILSRRRCCICFGLNRDTRIKLGQIAHLDGNSSNNELDNLAFLCFEHHDQYDTRTSQSKGLTSREVRRYRKELHEVIEQAWKQPMSIAGSEVRSPGDISGRYIRETDYESAELEVTLLENNQVHITGVALWGTTREFGPNIGEIDFEAPLKEGRVEFTDSTLGEEYKLEIRFENGRAFAKEQYVVGFFGMNVSFEGEYARV